MKEVKALPHHYAMLLEELLAAGIFDQFEAGSVTVYHDPWCAIHARGTCNCDPMIRMEGKEYLYSGYFDAHGEVRRKEAV